MSRGQPPRLATYLLDQLASRYRRDALIGDLIEGYRRGGSKAWYWRQVLCALVSACRGVMCTRRAVWLGLSACWCLTCVLALAMSGIQPSYAAETVSFPSGSKTLHGLLYKPSGSGPFPTVLYNHGSAPGMLNNQAFALIAPIFIAHGWAFFAPYRRGQGLSSNAGPYIEDQIAAARARGGLALAAQTMVKLLSTEQLQDQMAALAWLKKQAFVRPGEIAVMGNSFGGIETVLGAAHGGYCAAVDASGGAESWNSAPGLRTLMLDAVRHAQAPIFFLQARNDYSIAPSKVLYASMQAAGKPARIRIYPPYGKGSAVGHSFAWRGATIWKVSVLAFLDRNCRSQ